MGTTYYIACEKCKKAVDMAKRGPSGVSFYSGIPECMEAFRQFLEAHPLTEKFIGPPTGEHVIRILTEHDIEWDDYTVIEWD